MERTKLDELQRLWTPWRMAYILGDDDRGVQGCPFCVLPDRDPAGDRETLILRRGALAYVILNAFPYNPGHCMIVPFRHEPAFGGLNADELHEMAELTQLSVRALAEASDPEGFNVGCNLGRLAGAGITDHVHQHVVPRWSGDTNFMPVIGNTRVLPEALEQSYDRLVDAFARA